ncbi:hypothetical protein [Hymenobacter elongatus]|uniref:Glycosyltransferase RgtA/B/C/D-like domain-containing protein n=1 Tax=Hymenobacter elongatus TaxID=877208 RepID=A0A4Z0PUL0_9BACT|nr:hypothetical protein [Hymenobacter elongatus]TGE20082.1 hypothetical protein E5J99_00495 [Hymenobacter elongatus]
MKIVVAVGLNLLLLALALAWGRRQYHSSPLGRLLLPLLGLKMVAGVVGCLLLSDDADYFQRWSVALTSQLWDIPGRWLLTLAGDAFWHKHQELTFHGYSNTFFIIKVLSVLNLASLGSLLLNALYVTLFGFIGAWELATAVARALPQTPQGAAVVAFLLWPTVVYWTAGLTKECLLLGSGAWLFALVIRWLYGSEIPRVGTVVGALLLAFLHFKMRFFFAVMLFAAIGGLALIRLVQQLGGARRRWLQVVLFAALLIAGVSVVQEISPVFRFNKFTGQLIRTYADLREGSRLRPHIEYADLAPTAESILRNTPKAIVSTVVRPMPWEELSPMYVAAGLENILLVLVLVGGAVAVARGQPGQVPFALVLVLGFYCLALAALLGLSTPNLGTLNRYRSVMLPYLLWLALQNPVAARWLRHLSL